MNQIAQMFMDSNARMRKILKEEFNLEKISAAQREFEGQIKLINAVVAAYGIASKNKRALAGMEKMNLLDDTTVIDLGLGDPNEDKIKCPDLGKILTRAECLDYSGDHIEDCLGCETGAKTKEKLLG